MRTFIRDNTLILLAMLLIALGGWLLTAPHTSASQPNPDHKVTICHRTNSDTNPYVQITVDIASSGHLKGGHDTRHEGPIWNPTLKDQHIKWGDIIPPYEYGSFSYPGQNWTDEGRRIYDNSCQIIVTPTPTPTASETPTAPPSSEPTPTVTPTAPPSVEPSNTPTNTPIVRERATPPPTDTDPVRSVSPTNPPAAASVTAAVIAAALGMLFVTRRLRQPRRR